MIDLNEARRFLTLLDPNAQTFTFQTFGEGKAKHDGALTLIRHSSLDGLARTLLRLNRAGAGIFVTVNETDGQGRKAKNITRIRAVWQEDDHGYAGDFPLEPSVVVQTSPGKCHRYWLLDYARDVSRASTMFFTAVMNGMVARYGCDDSAKDMSRVLRIPGFFHNKGAPILVKIADAGGQRYTAVNLFRNFALPRTASIPTMPRASVSTTTAQTGTPLVQASWSGERERLRLALKFVSADKRNRWFRYGAAIYDASGGSEEGFQLWDEWSRTTKSGNYNADEQHQYWNTQFKSDRKSRTTLATIYRGAAANGWTESTSVPEVDEVFELPTIDQRHTPVEGWVTRPLIPSELEHPPLFEGITTIAMAGVRNAFPAYGHDPSPDHWRGLEVIARIFERMAHGVQAPRLYVSFLPAGMGKTTTITEATKALISWGRFDDVGIIIFLSRCEEIRRLANDLGLASDDFAVVVGRGRDEFNVLGRQDDKTQARVLFTTQQMLEAKSARGAKFAEMDAFFFRGKPRQVRVWDEAILPSAIYTLGQYDISDLFKPFGRHHIGLTNDLKALFATLEAAKSGDLITVVDIRVHGVALEEALSLVKRDDHRRTIEALWALSGHTVRLRKEKYANAALHYEDILPEDLAPLLILDASGQQRNTYVSWFKHRGGLKFLYSPQKSYQGFTIHHWDRGAGQDAHRTDGHTIAQGIAKAINDDIPATERVLVVHFKEGGVIPNMAEKIGKLIRGDKGRVSYLTWGRHTATNEYSDIKHVILAGVLQYSGSAIEATGRSAKRMKKEEAFSDDDFNRTRLGELAHHILQAANRGMVRKSIGGCCPPGCHLYTIFSSHKKVGIPTALLARVFPGADIVDWLPVLKLSRKNSRTVELLVRFAASGRGLVTKAELAKKLNVTDRSYLNRILKRKDVVAAVNAKGITFSVSSKDVSIGWTSAPKVVECDDLEEEGVLV